MRLVPTVNRLPNEANRLLNAMLANFGDPTSGEILSDWAPRVDVTEDNETYRVGIELPGMTLSDINVSVEDNTLLITGERKAPELAEGVVCHRSERAYGTFKRVFSIPSAVDGEKVSADYRSGVLSVVLPKAEHVKPKKIEIRATD